MTEGATARPAPDWNFWRQIPTVKVWEAVALSLNIEPKTVKRVDVKGQYAAVAAQRDDRIGRMAKIALLDIGDRASRFDESTEFSDRLEVTIRNNEAMPTAGGAPADDPADRLVRLWEFATWARALGWVLPSELKKLALTAKQKSQLNHIQTAYDTLAKTGREPSQREVAELASWDRQSVVAPLWTHVRKKTD